MKKYVESKTFSAARRSRAAGARFSGGGQNFGSLHATVVEQIGRRIVQGDFLPGEALPNADDSSEMLGVSRTILREAIKVLAGKGLVESRPKTGTRVRPRADWNFLDSDILSWRYSGDASVADIEELFELRRAIEPMAAALAAKNATAEQIAEIHAALAEMEEAGDDGEQFAKPDLVFHQTILRMTGNELIGSLAALIETALLMSFRLTNDNPRGQHHSLPLHCEVAEKITAGDGLGAQAALLVLIDNAEEDVRIALESRGDHATGKAEQHD